MPSKWPVVCHNITSWFGNRFHPKFHRYLEHTGVDIGVTYGSKVYAAGDGIVTFAGRRGGYGNAVMINHGYGYQTLYGHNSKIVVKVGSKVKKGDLICYSGNSGTSTGPHLHYEVLVEDKPVNPALFLRK
jgi:murein DD-endopeptidase MepM/ murein hydrolase activator NlpD